MKNGADLWSGLTC